MAGFCTTTVQPVESAHGVDFAPTKELVAGFWLWQVKSMEEAVE